ncbi:MAG: DNA polymerase-2 [Arenicella sp.]|jgi:DNA polymerase-2
MQRIFYNLKVALPSDTQEITLANTMTEIHTGFLLTRSSVSRYGRTDIEYWLASDLGPVLLTVADQRPLFFIAQEHGIKAETSLKGLGRDASKADYEVTPLDLKTFEGRPVSAVYTATSSDAYHVQDSLKRANIELHEADIRPHDRYLMERFAYGSVAFTGELKQRKGFLEFNHAKLKSADYQASLSAVSLDIECAMDGELFSVGLATMDKIVSEVLMIGDPQVDCESNILWFDNEKDLLLGLCHRISVIDPDLIIGWNVINFDMRILIERAEHHKIKLRLGRGNREASWRNQVNDPSKGYVSIAGRVTIDGIDALKSATWTFPSFSLENVAQRLLGRGKKVEQGVDDRVAEIVHNFHHDKAALAAYNLEDCRLVLDIFEHTKIIDYLILRSKITGLELDRAGGSVAAFTNLYLPRLHRGGYVAPNLPQDGGLASPGGYVMDSTPGLYRNVLVLDFKSLYPSIIRTFKIDPMGLIEGLAKPEDSIPGFRGGTFDREKHYLPQIITDLWVQRDQAKRDGDKVRSQAIKIIMNSFYGVLGSGGCRFYDTRLASSITIRGHEIMQTTGKWIEDQGYEVIYGDTDSTFVSLDNSLDSVECNQIGGQLVELINQRWAQKLTDDYQLDCLLEIEFETHFSRFFMPTIRGSEAGSKKRYAGLIIDSKTQHEKIIFKGLENIRTDWTELAKEFQAKLFDHVFHDRDPTELVKNVVVDTLAGKCDAKLNYRKQLRRKLELYVKNVPPHVRAARFADQQNSLLGKSLLYQNKGWISYVMTTNGPEPIEYHTSQLDYDHYIEKQIKPIADAVLPFIGYDFDTITSNQIQLF